MSLKIFVHDTFSFSDSHDFDLLMQEFEQKEGVRLEWISYGNSLLALKQRMQDPTFSIDLVYGIDNTNLLEWTESRLFLAYKSTENDFILDSLNLDRTHTFAPVNYSWLAFEYSLNTWHDPLPTELKDLVKEPWAKNYIVTHPRTSGIGLLLALWLEAQGYPVSSLLPEIVKNAFSVSPSWGAGYTLYTLGEAPFVLTYGSSPAYHKAIEKDDSQRTVLDKVSSYVHVEFIGIAKSSWNPHLSKRFVDHMLSQKVQETLPRKVWSFPVRRDVALPEEFDNITPPSQLLSHTPEQVQKLKEAWLASTWF